MIEVEFDRSRRSMTGRSDTASTAVDEDAGRRGWPDTINEQLAELLVDRQFIDLFDSKPVSFVREFQMRRITQLGQHAARQSSWWRERLGGFAGERAMDLAGLSVLGREELRASIEQEGPLPTPPHHGPVTTKSTSGASGIPVTFFVTRLAGRLNRSHWFHDDARQGRDAYSLRAELSGRTPKHSGEHIVLKRHQLLGSATTLRRRATAWTVAEHARWLSANKPAYLLTIPSLLAGLLDVYESGAAAAPQVSQVMTYAETVDAELRRRTKSILNASIRDQYSSEETGPIAFQCPRSDNHYHIANTNVFVEIVDETGGPSPPGSLGRVLVTALNNYATPFIRYELNDLAAWQPACVCGHRLPVLTSLLGRKTFLVRLPSGERKFFRVRGDTWLFVAPVREHRLMQVSEGVLRADLVLDRPITEAEKEAVLAMLRKELSPDLTYEVHQVERIDWAPTYKRQDVVSLV